VDFEKRRIAIIQQLDEPNDDGTPAFCSLKTTHGARTISVGEDVMRLLRTHRAHQNKIKLAVGRTEHYDDNQLVFCREYEHVSEPEHRLGQPVYIDHVGPGRLKRIAKLANVKTISPHGLRDTAASLLAADGVPIKVIAERLGHSKVELTLTRYIAVYAGAQEAAGERLNALRHG